MVGGKRDDSGDPGLDYALAGLFPERLRSIPSGRQSVHQADLPLGHETSAARSLLRRLGPKIDDYFNRRLATLNEDAASRPRTGADSPCFPRIPWPKWLRTSPSP
ncbi:hypothetical protein [uncultured Desulfovibrio sp.]|uniref:hypothetical protein n=1 Tax=uncultured Desulfovibrio sp. TaxID=167968 RepID=UPI00260A98F1|nr:hypothetical protein [uncultured Desulfovibrio sp.]